MIEQKVIPSKHFMHSAVGMKVTNVLCSDGKYRTFTATAENDTFFTTPGRVKVKGKTVSGHLYHDDMIWQDDKFPNGLWKFTAYTYLKNGNLLPEWKKECSKCHREIERGEEVRTFSYYFYHKEHLGDRVVYDG